MLNAIAARNLGATTCCDFSKIDLWTRKVKGIGIFELPAIEDEVKPEGHYTMFHAAGVGMTPLLKSILDEIEAINPARVVFDSLSELRLLSRDPLKYRRQIIALKNFFSGRNATVLLLEDSSVSDNTIVHELQCLCHGVIHLQNFMLEYGAKRRRMSVRKMRGIHFRTGFHDFDIKTGGLVIYPRLVASDHSIGESDEETVKSGVAALDRLLGGGLERGTSSLIIGAAGTGKTSLAVQYTMAIASGGERAALYIFDEVLPTLIKRSERLGIGLRKYLGEGEASRIHLTQIDPAEVSPGEFIDWVRKAVTKDGVRAVVIDSLNGYLHAMSHERFLLTQMHELFSFLNQQGVLTILVVSQPGIVGAATEATIDLSYLADTVILLRYFEAGGEIRKAISVVKKRSSYHEPTISQFRLTDKGVEIGEKLHDYHGILTGSPAFTVTGAAPRPPK